MVNHKSISLYYKAIWLIYIVMAPFYVLGSGYPQPADGILILGAAPALALIFLKSNFKISSPVLIGFLFVGLTFLINVTHFAFSPDRKLLLSSIYYIYNFAIFLFVVDLFKKSPEKINRLTYIGLAISILLEFAVVIFEYGQEFRSQGSFNNPNQLGYWSLLSFSLLIIIKRDKKINLIDVILILITFAIQTMSLSKAGIVSMVFCSGILFFSKIMTNTQRILVVVAVIFSVSYAASSNQGLMQSVLSVDTIQAAYTRLSTIGMQGDDSLEGRGYNRIKENPHYLILGAGEGANARYNVQKKELHSGLATLVFSYGILGAVLFFVFLFYVFRQCPWRHIFLIIPIMLYGLTHQNIRFTYFWVVIAAAYSGRYYAEKDDELLFNDSYVGEAPPRKDAA
jgi:hypothetical protein